MEEKQLPASNIALTEVESSRISHLGHDAATETLAVRFRNRDGSLGRLYHYQNFTAKDYEAFIAAESLGSHFERHIRPNVEKYPYTRMADPAEETA